MKRGELIRTTTESLALLAIVVLVYVLARIAIEGG